MKILLILSLTALPARPALAGAFEELAGPGFAAAALEAPAAKAVSGEQEAMPACPGSMKGDRSAPCVITTRKTTVCSDGQKIDASRVAKQDVKAGRFDGSELGRYKDPDLRAWAEHQRKLGKSDRWGDGSHQSMLASGKANPLTTAYVVLPNRQWLGRAVRVCLKGTKVCTEARALEVGPGSTFRDHSEISVRALMDLGLDAHPESGTYNGEIVFTFH